jgi:hypothetical protein
MLLGLRHERIVAGFTADFSRDEPACLRWNCSRPSTAALSPALRAFSSVAVSVVCVTRRCGSCDGNTRETKWISDFPRCPSEFVTEDQIDLCQMRRHRPLRFSLAHIRDHHWSWVECFAASPSRSANCLSPQVCARADALAQVGVCLPREGRGAEVFIVAIDR